MDNFINKQLSMMYRYMNIKNDVYFKILRKYYDFLDKFPFCYYYNVNLDMNYL